MKCRTASLALALALSALGGTGSPIRAQGTRIITDMDSRKVEVPVTPKRIACMHGVSSDRITMLGKGDCLVLAMKPSPWAAKLYPETRNLQTVQAPFTGNVERMLSLKADLVLYAPYPGEAEKYRAAGLHTACGFSAQKRPRTLSDFLADFKRQVRFFGDLLGPDAKARSENYCRYFDRKIGSILAITSKIPPGKRPSVYYGGMFGNPLATQGKASVMHWMTEIAGGRFLPQAIDANFTAANLEQVLSWNPDVIFLSGWGSTPGSTFKSPAWAAMRATRSGRVHVLPTGVFAWDYASGESVLLAIYMAKQLHPEQFRNWNMVQEMRTFYSEVYGKTVSDKDAERILQCLPPL
ncbi:ABC transporter substrate-binding protein [Holophaga foetida]|uniref:ABC transporter substrate-binding protein n=1 Tax=Holophaga foetida TaxID=35839 RepID=UPI0002473EF5|nr:ABC transporter substrate-binding protein [Holophaga foetida]